MSIETNVTCSGEERGGVVEGHEVARGGHGVAGPGEGGATGRSAGEPAALYRVSRALPATSICPAFLQVTVSILKCVISATHLEKVSGGTRGALLSCSMASCGEGAGKGSTRLGGLPGLTVRRSHQTPCQYCTVLYCCTV